MPDVTGGRIKVPKVTEATSLGGAMAAGAGVYKGMVKAAEELVVWDKEYFPNTDNFSKYALIKEQWQEVYENQLRLVDGGLTQAMWKAPGV